LVNKEADIAPDELRASMDVKATVKLGPLSRGGKSRVPVHAADHDFDIEQELRPVGILLPDSGETFISFVTTTVTADCLVDVLRKWWGENRKRFPLVKRLVLNLDNGPECHSRRTQFIKRLVEFIDWAGVDVRLAYYPPYHSKYNPIERVWAVLERGWNGDLLDNVEAVLGHASSITWKGIHPVVSLVRKVYKTGKKLSKKAMDVLEERLERWPGVEKWFVDISCRGGEIG
jgi:hypothetical protein